MDIRRSEIGGRLYEVRFSDDLSELPEAARIRSEVFVEEQGFENEFDVTDGTALHCVLFFEGTPAAAGRLYGGEAKDIAHIGRVAVVKSMRGTGIGSAVMNVLEQAARERGYSAVTLSAQCRAEGFYRAGGYEPEREVYYDEYCPHIRMKKKL